MRPSRRQMPPFTRRWAEGRVSATSVLVGLQAFAYTFQLCLDKGFGADRSYGDAWLPRLLGLSGEGIASGNYWQFISFFLLHSNPFHVLANALILFFVGRELEPILGKKRFVGLFVLGTLVGGLAHWLITPAVPLLGMTAGVVALLVAFTTTLPELEVTMNLFFVLPVRLRAKHLATALVGVCAILWCAGTSPEISSVAMLAGCAVGWLSARHLGFGNPLFFQRYLFEKRQRAARLERMTPDQFISAEIDPILEKISREGMQSLTRAERKILDQGREKIAAKSTQA
ncbi:MAG: rhomboid family intramembrane serine protease [Chthoniobacteraceae bacterium]